MKRTKAHLNNIKKFVDLTYTRFQNSLQVDTTKVLNPSSPELGYCYKYKGNNVTIYNIVCSRLNKPDTDFRILMHEYGHVYFGHLDGIHEELDRKIIETIRLNRADLIEYINKSCSIDFADKLIERIIDDDYLNHSLHNIAMDMEVNSKILSGEDITEMEQDISEVLGKKKIQYLEGLLESEEDELTKEFINKELEKMRGSALVKLIIPERYHFADGKPFPNELTYPEYLMLIIKHLDQFIKMLVSIKKGGNGDTSDITSDEVSQALSSGGNGEGQSDDGNGSGNSGMQSLDDLMDSCGMSDPKKQSEENKDGDKGKDKDKNGNGGDGKSGDKEKSESPWKGDRGTVGENGSDHNSESRENSDKSRELGTIRRPGGSGCSSSGGSDGVRDVDVTVDTLDMAMDEILEIFHNKVVKREYRKDPVYNYNRGINRTVIAPTYRCKITTSVEPTFVFLIDISGSMDTELVDRVLVTIPKKMKKIQTGLKYNIISWNTSLGEHIKDIDPREPVPRISVGGGTSMAGGIEYFRENYGKDAILVLISDFEDYLQEWHKVEKKMSGYVMYGLNYGSRNYDQEFTNFKVKFLGDK